MRPVAVYQDYVHNNGSLVMALQDLNIPYAFVDAADLAYLSTQRFSAFIMPGGADLYYREKLDGAGNAAIRAFVEAGGGYLGICAGAYYGCTALDWNKGEIAGARELGFINAVATGPIFIDINASWYEAVTINDFKTLYAAGPTFESCEACDVLANYTDLNKPAVVGKRVGLGYVVLSSPHIEALNFGRGRYTHNAKYEAHERAVAAALQPHLAKQQEFLTYIMQKIGVTA